jgi:hypothetical protein
MWILTTLLLLIPHAYAEEVAVTLLSEDVAIEQIVSRSVSYAHADISGKGSAISLTYTSAKPLSVFVVFQNADGAFTTFETLQTILPAGKVQEALIDLTKSPGWGLGKRNYRLYFFGNSEAGAEFHDIEFKQASAFSIISTGIRHFSMKQAYSPASYHRLPGYRILDIPLTVVVGIVLLLIVGFLQVKKRVDMIVSVVVILVLVTQARFSIDAIAYSFEHSKQWITNGTYATAGSLPSIAARLQKEDASSVYLCHTGTTYATKLLQYHAYPVLITDAAPSHIVVHRSTDWSIDGETLRCGAIQFRVTLVENYSDGSALYQNES